jgi:Helix-turn-helix domain of resolvase/Resolvase, N terminal domain
VRKSLDSPQPKRKHSRKPGPPTPARIAPSGACLVTAPSGASCGSGALAEFERSLIRERTQAGLAAARRAGRTGGRPPKLTDDDIEAAKAMLANPDIAVTQIAQRLGVSPATLYRYIPAARTANTPGG